MVALHKGVLHTYWTIVRLYVILYIQCTCVSVRAATINVEPGDQTLSNAIRAAVDDDVIQMTAGKFLEPETIVIDKRLKIFGDTEDTTQVVIDSTVTAKAFVIGKTFNVTYSGFSIEDSSTNSKCIFDRPYDLEKNITVQLIAPNIRDNQVNIRADFGQWYRTRQMVDFYFGKCSYGANGPAAGDDAVLDGGSIAIMTASCNGMLSFSAKFDKLDVCGVIGEDTPEFTYYKAIIAVWMNEMVFLSSEEDPTPLPAPLNRNGIGMTKLAMELSRVKDVAATITVVYPGLEIEAAVIRVDEGAIDNWNYSTVTLQLALPAPYTVATNYSGKVDLLEMNDETAVADAFFFAEQCNGLKANDTCAQKITYDILTCDMTGSYAMMQIPLICEELNEKGEPAECPTILSKADIYFYLDTNNFCDLTRLSIDALFQPTIELRQNETFLEDREIEPPFSLGDMSYWAIQLWTNVSGVTIADSYVTRVERTSNGDCEPYPDYMDDVQEDLNQTFMPKNVDVPPEIRMPIPVTTEFSCAGSDSELREVTMNFTVLVDYLDSSLSTELRRRRMAETSHNLGDIYDSDDMSFTSNSKDTRHSRRRRNAGEVKVGTSAGVDTKVQDLIEGLNSTGDAGNSTAAEDDMTMYYVGGAIALGLLLCCCLCCCICCCLVIKRRRENARKKTVVALSEQYMKAPGQSQSSVHVMGGSQNTPGGSAESSMSMSGKALSTNVNQNQNNRQSTRGSMRRGIPGNGLNGPNVPNRPPGNGPNVPNRPPHGNMPYNHPPQQQQPYNPQHPQFSNAMVNTHNAGPMRMSVMHNTNMPPLHQQQQQQPQQQQQSVHPGMYPPNMHQPHGPPMPQQQQLQSQQSQPKMKQQPDLQVTGGSSGFYNVR